MRSHEALVRRYLQEGKVEQHLKTYDHIRLYYPLDALKKCEDTPPYYCHYLAWRLGTKPGKMFNKWAGFFDGLLANASSLGGWNQGSTKKSSLMDCKFAAFWHFLWELQLAKFFSDSAGAKVEWLDPAPDFKVITNQGDFYVECFVFTRYFELVHFIEQLCCQVDPRIRVEYPHFRDPGLPNDKADDFLDEVFSCLNKNLQPPQGTRGENRILFSRDHFITYLAGDPMNPLPASRVMTMQTGNSQEYLDWAVKEALKSKIDGTSGQLKSGLDKSHPHVLAVNFLLSRDAQIALKIDSLRLPNIWKKYDAVLFTVCGIDKLPSANEFYVRCRSANHPLLAIDGIKAR
jgi:hypothetical protein